jgi:TonB family protein
VVTGVVAVLGGATLCTARPSLAQASDADRWGQLYAANDLAKEGALPFHLKMSFQLYDFAGKPREVGSVEEWWVSPTAKRIVVSAPSLKEDGKPLNNDSPTTVRESYLVKALLNVTLNPVQQYGESHVQVTGEQVKKFGKIQLRCVSPKLAHSPAGQIAPIICTEPGTDEVRFATSSPQYESVVRNVIGQFRGVNIAQETQLNLIDQIAMSGKVIQLQGFNPKDIDIQVEPTDNAVTPDVPQADRAAGRVVPGHLIKSVEPIYPKEALKERPNGNVVVYATITPEGNVGEVVPLAASDPVFVEAALDAVRQYKFSPFKRNGAAVEVQISFQIGFSAP